MLKYYFLYTITLIGQKILNWVKILERLIVIFTDY